MLAMEIDDTLSTRFNNLTTDSPAFRTECSKLAQSVTNNEISMINVVEQLEVYLANPQPEQRQIGTCILYKVIELLPNDFLTSDQLHFICTFYSDRLKDHYLVIPTVLNGIASILQQENIPEGACTMILTSLFHNVACQQQQQADRYTEFKIFEIMLEKKEHELKSMGLDFVYGVMSSIEGERDPKNLLCLFNWLPHFFKTIDLKHLTEDMFDIVSCYFPVDFRVPSQQANAIQRDDLALALSPCLCAIPGFAEFCIPLALEKLASNLKIAKIDSLELLFSGCETFPTDKYLLHASEIWPLIQKEALNSTDNEIKAACHKTLTAFIEKISENFTAEPQVIIENIIDTVRGNLQPEQKLFMQSMEIVKSVTSAGLNPAKHVTAQIVPLLTNLYNITEKVEGKLLVFKAVVDLFVIYTGFSADDLSDDLKLIPRLCLKISIETEVTLQVMGLKALAAIAKNLDLDLRRVLYENLKTYLISIRNNHLNDALSECIKSYAEIYTEEISTLINETHSSLSQNNFNNFITAVVDLGSFDDFHEVVVKIILNESVCDVKKSEISVHVLKKLLLKENKNLNLFKYIHKNDYIKKLIEFTINQSFNDVNINYFIDVNDVLKILIGELSGAEQSTLLTDPLVNKILEEFKNKRGVLVFVLNGLFERLRRDVVEHLGVLSILTKTAFEDEEEQVREISAQLLANMINKLRNDGDLTGSIEEIESICDIGLNQGVNVNRVCTVIAWMTKGLIMRGHELAMKWVKKMLVILEKTDQIAKGFKIVINDRYDCLSPLKSFCNKRLLYQQLFFTTVCNAFKEHMNVNEHNPNYLLAYGYMLEEVPEQILKINFNENLQLIVLCLNNCQDPCALIAVLTTLKSMIANKDSLMENHVQDFIPIFLRLSKFQPSMKVRILSLQCLSHFTSGYSLLKLLPLKMTVVMELADCIDDKKRLVRKEATETRMLWFLIDAPKD